MPRNLATSSLGPNNLSDMSVGTRKVRIMMPTPRLEPSDAVWKRVYRPPAQVVPELLSHGRLTSCRPMISARNFRQKRASSSSCRVAVEQVSGLACTRVRYCCCSRPAPQIHGARVWPLKAWSDRPVETTGGSCWSWPFRGACPVVAEAPPHATAPVRGRD